MIKKTKTQKFSVRELNETARNTLIKNFPSNFLVKGEVGGLKSFGGNLYFTLKDADSCIGAVMWKSACDKNNDGLKEGDKITARGKLDIYIKSGKYQIQIFSFEKDGLGDIHTKYVSVKNEYIKKGYFDAKRKKKLPKYIKSIGVVTSKEGAVIQDILTILKKHKFQGTVYIQDCCVQGENCPDSIVSGINYFQSTRVDIIVIARGGGSFEDLVGFSNKKVIEEIYKSKIFTISAVGHEVDFMLSDFVADLRAPTPSAGAEIIANHNKKYWEEKLKKYDLNKLKYTIKNRINNIKEEIRNSETCNNTLLKIIIKKNIRLKKLWNQYKKDLKTRLNMFKNDLDNTSHLLDTLDPDKRLKGCAIIKDKNTTNIINDFKHIQQNQQIIVCMNNKEIICRVEKCLFTTI